MDIEIADPIIIVIPQQWNPRRILANRWSFYVFSEIASCNTQFFQQREELFNECIQCATFEVIIDKFTIDIK